MGSPQRGSLPLRHKGASDGVTRLPLCSSDEIVHALERAGFRPARSAKGTHLAMSKEIGGRTVTTVVILGKREVPRGTLQGILRLAEISPGEFTTLLRKR